MQEQDRWDECPSGVVIKLAGRLRRRRRLAQLRPFLYGGAAAALLIAIGYGLTSRDERGAPGKFDCRQTVPLLARYHDQSLDAVAAENVRQHLSRCPKCRRHFEERYPSEARDGSPVENGLLAFRTPLRR